MRRSAAHAQQKVIYHCGYSPIVYISCENIFVTYKYINATWNWVLLAVYVSTKSPLFLLAPAGCLMYYTSLTGTVRSLNYGTTVSGGLVVNSDNQTRPGTRELANLNYGVCIQMQPGYCSIQWSQSGSADTSFTVTGDTITTSVIDGLPSGSVIGENCTTDFVVIPNPYYVNGTAVPGDRFCGNQFPTVYSK